MAALAVDESGGDGVDVGVATTELGRQVDGEAAAERHGFIAAPEHPRRLFRRMKDVRSSIDPQT
ncbi:MAG: hypothetical protein U0V73_05800 [Acidimicrobiia bacterium]